MLEKRHHQKAGDFSLFHKYWFKLNSVGEKFCQLQLCRLKEVRLYILHWINNSLFTFLQNQWDYFLLNMSQSFLEWKKGSQVCTNEGSIPFPSRDNTYQSKGEYSIHVWYYVIFKLGRKHPWVKGVQVNWFKWIAKPFSWKIMKKLWKSICKDLLFQDHAMCKLYKS